MVLRSRRVGRSDLAGKPSGAACHASRKAANASTSAPGCKPWNSHPQRPDPVTATRTPALQGPRHSPRATLKAAGSGRPLNIAAMEFCRSLLAAGPLDRRTASRVWQERQTCKEPIIVGAPARVRPRDDHRNLGQRQHARQTLVPMSLGAGCREACRSLSVALRSSMQRGRQSAQPR